MTRHLSTTSFPLSAMMILGWVMLGASLWWGGRQVAEFRFLSQDAHAFETVLGQDWVRWKDTEQGPVAEAVHPLLSYKAFLQESFVGGDRLLKINYHEVYQAEVAEQISQHAKPGKTFIYQLERNTNTALSDRINIQWVNGHYLSYSFNEIGIWWRISLWLAGLGAFAAFLVFLILRPFFQQNPRAFLSLGLIIILAFLIPISRLGHMLYLVVESDLIQTSFEKWVFTFMSFLLIGYSLLIVGFRWQGRSYWLLPSRLTGAAIFFYIIYLIASNQAWGVMQPFLERIVLLFFIINLITALGLWLWGEGKPSARRKGVSLFITLCSLGAGLGLLNKNIVFQEHALFVCELLLLFPLFNAAYSRLPFGKVNVVMTRSLQYVVFIAFSLFVYVAIRTLFEWLIPASPYRSWLEIISFLLILMSLRALYVANENRFATYITTSQQQKQEQFKAFVAGIPQFTSPEKLRESSLEQLKGYFETENINFWWHGEPGADPLFAAWHEELDEGANWWSRNKELDAFSFESSLETQALASVYSLIVPITVSAQDYGLLLLGRKKRRVYNLSDLELIARLIQQMQLSLNVLQLLQRERELLEKSYEANLTALRSQINPHFLFNTLNTISALIHDSPDLAEDAVDKLAFIFRYTLRQSSQKLVSLDAELSLVSTYLEIEKIRFGERLKVQIEVEPEVRDRTLPAFVIQTLIENCIKHGIAKIIEKGIVSIDAYAEKGDLICEIYDNGPGIDPDRIQKGTGLRNILTRLEKIYGQDNLLTFENTGNGTLVRLRIPKA